MDKIKAIVAGTIIVALGSAMILYPDFAAGYEATGRNYFVKTVLSTIWGVWGGITVIILGILSVMGNLSSDDD